MSVLPDALVSCVKSNRIVSLMSDREFTDSTNISFTLTTIPFEYHIMDAFNLCSALHYGSKLNWDNVTVLSPGDLSVADHTKDLFL